MIANHTLSRAGTERLQRGVEGLASGAYCITVMRQNDDEINAQVANGDGKSCPVTLTAVRSFYSEAQTILGYVSAVADRCNEAEKKGKIRFMRYTSYWASWRMRAAAVWSARKRL